MQHLFLDAECKMRKLFIVTCIHVKINSINNIVSGIIEFDDDISNVFDGDENSCLVKEERNSSEIFSSFVAQWLYTNHLNSVSLNVIYEDAVECDVASKRK